MFSREGIPRTRCAPGREAAARPRSASRPHITTAPGQGQVPKGCGKGRACGCAGRTRRNTDYVSPVFLLLFPALSPPAHFIFPPAIRNSFFSFPPFPFIFIYLFIFIFTDNGIISLFLILTRHLCFPFPVSDSTDCVGGGSGFRHLLAAASCDSSLG